MIYNLLFEVSRFPVSFLPIPLIYAIDCKSTIFINFNKFCTYQKAGKVTFFLKIKIVFCVVKADVLNHLPEQFHVVRDFAVFDIVS